jgi:hypothetical protein
MFFPGAVTFFVSRALSSGSGAVTSLVCYNSGR